MLLAQLERRAQAVVLVVGRHLDVDDRHVGPVRAGAPEEVVGVAGLRHDLQARALEDPRDALAEEDVVLADDDPDRHRPSLLSRLGREEAEHAAGKLVLGDEPDGAGRAGRRDGRRVGIAGREQHARRPGQRGEAARQLEPVAVREVDVHERGLRAQVDRRVPPGLDRAGLADDGEPHAREQPHGERAERRVVVDDEYGGGHHRHDRRKRAFAIG